jgi:branched-chain amino acid transport system permease protein
MAKISTSRLLIRLRVTHPTTLWGVFALLALLPLIIHNDYYLNILTICLIYAALASTWNLMVGYAGILSFGHQAFYGLGAYFSAIITIHLGVSPWLGLPLGGLFAAFFSLAIGIPCLRLRIAPYIAIATLAFSEILLVVCKNWVSLTRGEMGLSGIPPLTGFNLGDFLTVNFGSGSKIPNYYVMLGIYILAMLTMYWLMNSKVGLALKSLREDQDAAASLGVDVTRYKLIAFLVSSFFAGVTGAFYAHYLSILAPDSVFSVGEMVEVVAITLVGGIGTFLGPTLGAFTLIVGLELLRGLEDYRFMIYGAMLVIVVLLLPNGLLLGFHNSINRVRRLFQTGKGK